MRILMLGNSLTTANHMPEMLAKKLGAEVVVHARAVRSLRNWAWTRMRCTGRCSRHLLR